MEYVSATDNEALDRFPAPVQAKGIIPALEPAHALAHVTKLAPTSRTDNRGDASAAEATRMSRRRRAPRDEGLTMSRIRSVSRSSRPTSAPGSSPISRPAIPTPRSATRS